MVIMLKISFEHNSAYSFQTGWTLDNYREILTDPLYRHVARDTFVIATAAMVIQFVVRGAAGLRDGVPGRPLGAAAAAGAGRWPTSSTRSCGSTPGASCSAARG